MFIGRETELKTLNNLYKSGQFEFVVIYGRRRVGKTALINEFIGKKNAIYFMGVESNAKQNLENLSKSIIEYVGGIKAETSFASYQAAFSNGNSTQINFFLDIRFFVSVPVVRRPITERVQFIVLGELKDIVLPYLPAACFLAGIT